MTTRASAPQRLLFLGTPEMAVPCLDALIAAGFQVVGVVTRADKRRGRGTAESPSAVKMAALRLGLPVVHSVDEGLELGADLGVVVAFGQLIKPPALARLPMVNLHFSLLPRWRGAAPVERALLAGDTETGVCLMQLDEGLDTGPVFARVHVPIGASSTGDSLRRELVEFGTKLLVDELRAGLPESQPQSGEPSYASKISSEDLRIDWLQPAGHIDRVIRLGGAWTMLRGKRLKVLAAELIDPAASGHSVRGDVVGGLRLLIVQPEGKAPMFFAAFANGARLLDDEEVGR